MHAKFSQPQKPRIYEEPCTGSFMALEAPGCWAVRDLVLPSWVGGLLRTGRIVTAQLAPLASLQPLCCSVF